MQNARLIINPLTCLIMVRLAIYIPDFFHMCFLHLSFFFQNSSCLHLPFPFLLLSNLSFQSVSSCMQVSEEVKKQNKTRGDKRGSDPERSLVFSIPLTSTWVVDDQPCSESIRTKLDSGLYILPRCQNPEKLNLKL